MQIYGQWAPRDISALNFHKKRGLSFIWPFLEDIKFIPQSLHYKWLPDKPIFSSIEMV